MSNVFVSVFVDTVMPNSEGATTLYNDYRSLRMQQPHFLLETAPTHRTTTGAAIALVGDLPLSYFPECSSTSASLAGLTIENIFTKTPLSAAFSHTADSIHYGTSPQYMHVSATASSQYLHATNLDPSKVPNCGKCMAQGKVRRRCVQCGGVDICMHKRVKSVYLSLVVVTIKRCIQVQFRVLSCLGTPAKTAEAPQFVSYTFNNTLLLFESCTTAWQDPSQVIVTTQIIRSIHCHRFMRRPWERQTFL